MLGVIFDMDGTLLDTQRIFIDAWDAVGLNYGIKNLGQHIPFVSGMSEKGWKQYLREHFPTLNVDAFQKDMVDFVARNLTLRYRPGAEALMDFLQEHHIPMAVASGTDRAIVDHHLGSLGALTRFDAIVGGDEVPNSKPAPDVFLRAAELIGRTPEECIVFEDSANGVLAARNAGMRCIGIPDIAAFPKDVKGLLMAELPSLDKAIDLLKAHQ